MSQQPPHDAEPHVEDASIEPEDLYTFDEFLAKQEVLEELHDGWIWHAFFDVTGSNNDINVLS
jgi:hypothetical protein